MRGGGEAEEGGGGPWPDQGEEHPALGRAPQQVQAAHRPREQAEGRGANQS